MSKVKCDSSWVREGRSLSEWLIDLVSEDRAVRARAANALGGMQFGIPRFDTDWADLEDAPSPNQRDRFVAAVREAARADGFPTADFVARLGALRLALYLENQQEGRRSIDEMERENPREDRLIETMATSTNDEEKRHAARRFARLFCASLARDQKRSGELESYSPTGMVSAWVFDALDATLLIAPSMLRLLYEAGDTHSVVGALARIGPGAASLADLIIPDFDRPDGSLWSAPTTAFGAISRDQPDLVEFLITRLRGDDALLRARAAMALESAGPHLAGRTDEVVDLLLTLTAMTEPDSTCIRALGSVGRLREDVADRLVQLAASRPARIVRIAGEFEHEYDAVAHERGAAIDSLGYMTAFPGKAVPVLIEATESFDEYDGDLCYDGECVRVLLALKQFKGAAAPAIPTLIGLVEKYIHDVGADFPRVLLDTLRNIGPVAIDALKALRDIHRTKDQRELLDALIDQVNGIVP